MYTSLIWPYASINPKFNFFFNKKFSYYHISSIIISLPAFSNADSFQHYYNSFPLQLWVKFEENLAKNKRIYFLTTCMENVFHYFLVSLLSLVKQPVFLVIFSLIYKHQNVHFLIQMKKAQKIACCEVLLTGTAKEIWWQTQTITSTDLYGFLENDT